ncbi:glutathione S-transferase family protein [Spirulina sp. CS-785/01]|uniref:glutathione S-transferase family protein n=1 Tax=Spirulina sp. CS-785/01 TaxID=3021716 RepID=UPI00232E5ED9|nr:glutathione S-transferase family protein [Spirulina sp. CS-785/01]MDB9311771.1 glutathione S-transferase family protein [Spirulina sp. CS-785/01]
MVFRLYQSQPSGNCYKIRLLLSQLQIEFEKVEIDIFQKETRTPEFLEKNLNGRVPVLETEEGKFLAESNAILYYLSDETHFLPNSRWERAQILQWLFFEQYSHEPYIATSRYWISLLKQPEKYQDLINQKRDPGYAALQVIEKHLTNHPFFVLDQYTIADIALFAYTHVADEGGFELNKFPHILNWIERVKEQPNYIPITA